MRFVAGLLAGLFSLCALPISSRASTRAELVVSTTNDDGPGSLRKAIVDANDALGPDTIRFAIPGAAPHVIAPASDLPEITEAITIDGTSQPGFVDRPVVELRGNDELENGLEIRGGFSVVRGLAVDGFDVGIRLVEKSSSVVEGCFVGTDTSGVEGRGNTSAGISIERSAACRIGGTAPGAGNVIARNGGEYDFQGGIVLQSSSGTTIQGNSIGTDRTGSAHIGNEGPGVRCDGGISTTIGGVEEGAANVIAYNGGPGVSVRVLSRIVSLSNSFYGNGKRVENLDGRYDVHFEIGAVIAAPQLTFVGDEAGGTRVAGGVLDHGFLGYPARVELYLADSRNEYGYGQGKTLLGSVDAAYDATGLVEFSTVVPFSLPSGASITATLTPGTFGTSAFSSSVGDTAGCTLPLLTRFPDDMSVRRGQTATIDGEVTGNAPLAYQWLARDPIPGATTTRLTTGPISESTFFSLRATNPCGTTEQGIHVYACDDAPQITEQPASRTVARGTSVGLTVGVYSSDVYFVQWYHGDSGDTSNPVPWRGETYSPPLATERASYWARISNGCGTVDSATATLDVREPIAITSIKVKRDASGASRLVAKGKNLGEQVFVSVDAFRIGDFVAFESEAKVKGSKVIQAGALRNGRTVDEMIPSGRTVRFRFSTTETGTMYVDYTRP